MFLPRPVEAPVTFGHRVGMSRQQQPEYGATQMNRISELITDIGEPKTFSQAKAFVGSSAAIFALAEMLGSILGWHTVVGHFFLQPWIDSNSLVIWQMFLILLPQLVISVVAGFCLVGSAWPQWIRVRFGKDRSLVLPAIFVRET